MIFEEFSVGTVVRFSIEKKHFVYLGDGFFFSEVEVFENRDFVARYERGEFEGSVFYTFLRLGE